MQFDQTKELLKGFSLPPQPHYISAIQEVAPDLGKMAEIIAKDPGLSSAILKVINSPSMNLDSKVTSIPHALPLLGFDSVTNILNAVAFKRVSGEFKNTEKLEIFWQQTTHAAISMATITRELGIKEGTVSADEAYCLGLFHNCGMPAIFQKSPEYFEQLKTVYQNGAIPITDFENELYQSNHAVLGYYMMKSWNLPETICDVTRIHHNKQTLADLDKLDEKTAVLLALLKITEYIVGESDEYGDTSINAEWLTFGESIVSFIGVSGHDLENMKDVVLDTIEAETNIY